MKLGLGRRGLSFGGSGGPPKPVTDFFNGFELSGSTYSGGPTVVADNTGTLVTSPSGVLPLEGMRLATTVATGAVLGPELVTNGDNEAALISPLVDTRGVSSRTTEIFYQGSAALKFQADASHVTSPYLRQEVMTVGRRYKVSYMVLVPSGQAIPSVAITEAGILLVVPVRTTVTDSWVELSAEFVARYTSVGILVEKAVGGSEIIYVDNISVREVIPTWVATTSLGAQIHPSTPLRTRKGTVSVYGEAYKGPLIEPARTNLFLNSTSPVTQNITTTAQAYTVTVLGTGDVTLSGTATGTATQGSPLTVTASAGTLTCTVTGTLTRVNVEAGAFGTSFIDTAATTVTRPAANLTRPTAGSGLESGNDFAIYGRVVPKAEHAAWLCGVHVDNNNYIGIYEYGTEIGLIKVISSSGLTAKTLYTPAASIVFEFLAYQHSVHGMGIAVRSWNGSAWSAWSAWATNADTQNAPIASTYQIGARNNAVHFAANYPFTKIIALNPALNPQTQLADMLSKGRI